MMVIVPIAGLIIVLCLFSIIFFCIRWLVQKQWYAMLSVLSAHILLGYVHRAGWLRWEALGDSLLLMMTLICSILIFHRVLLYVSDKKKKRAV